MIFKGVRIFLFFAAVIFFTCFCSFAQIDFSPQDRILILAPHPDDEALALAGVIQRARSLGAQLKITYLTCGDYNELSHFFYKKTPALSKGGFIAIGKTRQAESYVSMHSLGLAKTNLVFLGYPDRFTESILTGFWNKKKPPASFLTHISRVPYENALSFGAPYVGQSILGDLKRVLIAFNPTKVFVSSPQDTNPDHRSLYVYLKIALLDLEEWVKPQVQIYLVHRAGWPKPKGYLPGRLLEPPQNFNEEIKWGSLLLSGREIENKRMAIFLYKSQLSFDRRYLLSFIRRNELFYAYPDIDLSKGNSSRFFAADSKIVSHIAYARDKDFIYIHIAFNRKIAEGIKADIYLLGYKYGLDFSLMPKIFFKAKGKYKIAYDKRKRIDVSAAQVEVNPENMFIKFPLATLAHPDYIFCRIILKGRIFALHIAPWTTLKL